MEPARRAPGTPSVLEKRLVDDFVQGRQWGAGQPLADRGTGQLSSSAKLDSAMPAAPHRKRHSALVRVTHWTTTVAFLALLVSGGEIVLSHPRFYWGETGNVNMPPWLNLHLP